MIITIIDVSTHGSFLIGLVANWDRFSLGSVVSAFLPDDLPDLKRQALKQHLDDHVGAELETSRVLSCEWEW